MADDLPEPQALESDSTYWEYTPDDAEASGHFVSVVATPGENTLRVALSPSWGVPSVEIVLSATAAMALAEWIEAWNAS